MATAAVYEHQVAGLHSGTSTRKHTVFRRGNYGRVLKPYKTRILKPETDCHKLPDEDTLHERAFDNELLFYEHLYASTSQQELSKLRALTPAYYGIQQVLINSAEVAHLALEDLTAGCRWPCTADVKMAGKDTRSKTYERRLLQMKKYPSLREVGWCIAGLKQYTASGAVISRLGPSITGAFHKQEVRDVLRTFFLCPDSHPLHESVNILLKNFQQQIQDILSWFKKQKMYWFRNSSILLVYNSEYFSSWQNSWKKSMKLYNSESEDATELSEDTGNSSENMASTVNGDVGNLICRVKMIDFAHVLKADDGLDSRYITGLTDIVELLSLSCLNPETDSL